jgi:hypothetical protein
MKVRVVLASLLFTAAYATPLSPPQLRVTWRGRAFRGNQVGSRTRLHYRRRSDRHGLRQVISAVFIRQGLSVRSLTNRRIESYFFEDPLLPRDAVSFPSHQREYVRWCVDTWQTTLAIGSCAHAAPITPLRTFWARPWFERHVCEACAYRFAGPLAKQAPSVNSAINSSLLRVFGYYPQWRPGRFQ